MKKTCTNIKLATLLLLYFFNTFADTNVAPIKLSIKNGEFDLIYHRAQIDSTEAVLFGIIGAAIQEGSKSSQDEEKSKASITVIPYIM